MNCPMTDPYLKTIPLLTDPWGPLGSLGTRAHCNFLVDAEEVAFHVNIGSFMASWCLLWRAPVAYRPPQVSLRTPRVFSGGGKFFLVHRVYGNTLGGFCGDRNGKKCRNRGKKWKNGSRSLLRPQAGKKWYQQIRNKILLHILMSNITLSVEQGRFFYPARQGQRFRLY